MFQRRREGSLPTTSSTPPQGAFGTGFRSPPSGSDGSGKAIKMDAPVVKAWKTASGFTKGSYYSMGFFLFLLFIAYRYLRYWNASIWVTCQAQECMLEIRPPGSRLMSVTFSRAQLASAQAVKVTSSGQFVEIDTDKYEPPSKRGKAAKKASSSYKGPDENGNYRSYGIKLLKESANEKTEDDVPDGDFSPVMKFLTVDEDGNYTLYMRQFGLSHSRTRIRSMVNKVESYVRKRRQKLIVKENASLPWQGIVCLVFGLLGIMLTLLIGQFWDEKPKRHAGPGVRRQAPLRRGPSKDSKFYVDTGRPSKYPKGYYPGMKK